MTFDRFKITYRYINNLPFYSKKIIEFLINNVPNYSDRVKHIINMVKIISSPPYNFDIRDLYQSKDVMHTISLDVLKSF
jgi:hypothetical protein